MSLKEMAKGFAGACFEACFDGKKIKVSDYKAMRAAASMAYEACYMCDVEADDDDEEMDEEKLAAFVAEQKSLLRGPVQKSVTAAVIPAAPILPETPEQKSLEEVATVPNVEPVTKSDPNLMGELSNMLAELKTGIKNLGQS